MLEYNKGKMSLHLFIGPMFSGKSTEMIKQIRRERVIGKNILVINSNLDKRYGFEDHVVNHDMVREPCTSVDELSKVSKDDIDSADTIFVEEAQFFKDLFENVTDWVDNSKKKVVVFGLDGDFKRKPFGQILSLIPHCDTVVRLTSLCRVCSDGTEAIFSKRITSDTSTIMVGSGEEYIPVCRKCYLTD